MSEHFSAWIQNRTEFEKGNPAGVWLDLPATKDQLHEAMKALNITSANPQDFRLHGHFVTDDKKVEIPLDLLKEPDFDTLNFLAARLEALDPAQLEKLNALCRSELCPPDLKRFLDYPDNTDCYVFIPGIYDYKDLGDYYLNDSGMVQMPEEWKGGIDKEAFGRNAAAYEQGYFTEQGYLLATGDEWNSRYEQQEIPDRYRVMSYPEPERPAPEQIEQEAALAFAAKPQTVTAANPARPIELKAEKPAEKMKEITDRLEQGIKELFGSDRFKEYLTVMSKFHNYSVNNTLLIAMQKPDATLVAGYNSWKNMFGRQVLKGAKGIKVIAPSPFKVKKEMEKIDPKTQKPVKGKDGKPVTQEVEITVPAFKVVSVFDVSQTEGKELPTIGVDELTGNVERYKDFFKAIEQASPVPVGFEEIGSGAHGYYHLAEKRIAINEGMSELQNLKTLIHEIAHAKLHDVDLNAPKEQQEDRPDSRTREVQAESIAYAVCQHYGLDTSDYSFGYVASWSSGRELAELKASLEVIRGTASGLIKDIDRNFAELAKAQEQAKEAVPAKEPQAKKSAPSKNPQPEQPQKEKNIPKKQPEFDLAHTTEYLRGLQEKIAAADPNKTTGIAAYNMTIKRLQKLTDTIPESYTELKSLIGAAIISPDLETLKERMAELCPPREGKEAENPLEAAEKSTEQNLNMIDGMMNNTPTVDELEARVKAGETISLVDLAEAVKNDRAAAKTGEQKPGRKPSIRKQLKEDKEKTKAAPKKQPAKSKKTNLERS